VVVPDEWAFDFAAKWRIQVPEVKSKMVSDILLRITYQGDIARVYAGGKLLTDNFNYGEPWTIGLGRIPASLAKSLELRILPLRAQTPIYLPSRIRAMSPQRGQLALLKKIELAPIYRAAMATGP
jgi:beta-galactosidase